MADENKYMNKISILHERMEEILAERDKNFIKSKTISQEEHQKLLRWDWPQGIGVYGIWKCYEKTHDDKYLTYLKSWYAKSFAAGLPGKNVNTVAPLLCLAFLYERTKDQDYLPYIKHWAEWIMNEMPRTKEAGFQHITCEAMNTGELWDDTLVMTVLFLAKMGKLLNQKAYVDEAVRQFFLHTKYLADRSTGLWFHGWTFEGNHNFAKALWARGNSWITIGITDLLEITEIQGAEKMFLVETLKRQIEALKKHQDKSGMWHTLIDDHASYLEASATAGFAYGILKSVRKGYISSEFFETGSKALVATVSNISDETGELKQCSGGTSMGRDLDFYRKISLQPMAYGQAMAMLALIEGCNHNI